MDDHQQASETDEMFEQPNMRDLSTYYTRPARTGAARELERMTANKQLQGPSDGRLEVALAVAATSKGVRVDATHHPFMVDPENLFDLSFNDPRVGISDSGISAFKACLGLLLPDVVEDIEELPDSSDLVIEDVAEYVRVSLLALP